MPISRFLIDSDICTYTDPVRFSIGIDEHSPREFVVLYRNRFAHLALEQINIWEAEHGLPHQLAAEMRENIEQALWESSSFHN